MAHSARPVSGGYPHILFCRALSFRCSYGPDASGLKVYVSAPSTACLSRNDCTGRAGASFDSRGDRTKDTFVFYECDGGTAGPAQNGTDLVCPRCRAELYGDTCDGCNARYETADGMLFLLPPQFAHVFDDYVRHEAAPVPAEHL